MPAPTAAQAQRAQWAANAFSRMPDAYDQLQIGRHRGWAVAGLRRQFHHVGEHLLKTHRWALTFRKQDWNSAYYLRHQPAGPVQAYRGDGHARWQWGPLPQRPPSSPSSSAA